MKSQLPLQEPELLDQACEKVHLWGDVGLNGGTMQFSFRTPLRPLIGRRFWHMIPYRFKDAVAIAEPRLYKTMAAGFLGDCACTPEQPPFPQNTIPSN
jgi:hypothetical protein